MLEISEKLPDSSADKDDVITEIVLASKDLAAAANALIVTSSQKGRPIQKEFQYMLCLAKVLALHEEMATHNIVSGDLQLLVRKLQLNSGRS